MRWDPAHYMDQASTQTKEDLVRLAGMVRELFKGFRRAGEIDERVAIAWVAYTLGAVQGNQLPRDLLEITVQMRMYDLLQR